MPSPAIPPSAPAALRLPRNAAGKPLGAPVAFGSTDGLIASRPTLLAADLGASFNQLADNFGLVVATPSVITGVPVIFASMKTANGSITLGYRASDHAMRCTLPGETIGAWVQLDSGYFNLPSGSSSNVLQIGVIKGQLPVADHTEVVATSTRYWRRPNGSWKYQMSFQSYERLKWMHTLGVGGSQSTDVAAYLLTALQATKNGQVPDIYFMCCSGNDFITGSMTVAQSVAQTLANLDTVLATGRPCVLQLLPPRWGKDAAGGNLAFTTEYTAARQGNWAAGNRQWRDGAMQRHGAHVTDFSGAIDPTANGGANSPGAIYNGWTADGKHMAGGLAHFWALANYEIVDMRFRGYRFIPAVGPGDYYDATNNPKGNLLASNQGAFAGTGGTKNSGVTNTAAWTTGATVTARAYSINAGNLYFAAGGGVCGATAPTHLEGTVSDGTVFWTFISSGVVAGLGDGYSATIEGTSVTATVHSVTERDGTRWQEFVVISANAADGNAFRVSPTAVTVGSKIAVDDLINFGVDVKLFNAQDCYGLFTDCLLTGGLAMIWDNQANSSIQQGMQVAEGRLEQEPLAFPTGVTSIQPRIHAQVKANGVFRVRFKNVGLYPVTT